MVNKTIQLWAEAKGLAMPAGDAALFESGGYLITYAFVAGSSAICVSVPVQDDSWSKETQKSLRGALGKAGTLTYSKGLIRVNTGTRTRKGHHEKFEQITEILLAELPRLGVEPAGACHYCTESGCENSILEDGACYPAHTECKEQKAEALLAEIRHNQENSNIPLGILGAIAGGILGSVPSFITAYFFDTIYSLAFALIPFLSYMGYKKCKGLMGAIVPFLISAVSLLCTVCLVLAYNFAVFYNQILSAADRQMISEMGVSPVSVFLTLVTGPDMRGDMISDLGKPILFCCLGIYIVWSVISKNNKQKQREAQNLVTDR